jgi:mono/diheme cytochrome c family protein
VSRPVDGGGRRAIPGFAAAVALTAAALAASPPPARAEDAAALARGEYVFHAAGCKGCHTEKAEGAALLAGGREFKTPFGVFRAPNITPDPAHGIGAWSDADFARALRRGVAPDGSHYFPVFPYPSYAGMSDGDLRDLFLYLRSLPPAAKPDKPHDVRFPFGFRPLLAVWKWLYFEPAPFRPPPGADAELGRAAYLVHVLGHCGECHTPRDWLGGPERARALAGTSSGPEGGPIPNITPDPETGIGRWSDKDLEALFTIGALPDGDFVGAGMGEVVENTTSRWSSADRKAVIRYLRSGAPVRNQVRRQPKSAGG